MHYTKLACIFIFFLCHSTLRAADDKLPQMKITVNGTIKSTMAYTNGTMELTDTDGRTVSLKAKFKTRGATASTYLDKPSLNMKLRTDDYSASVDTTLLGIRSASKWILDAMAIDRICMRNRVCMDIWNAHSPLPYDTDFGGRSGTEGKFVELYINNTYKGIYCLSDRINRKLLNLKKYNEDKQKVRGVLYKSGNTDLENQSTRNFSADWTLGTISWHNAWELKEPEDYECEAAWQPLIDLFDNQQTYTAVKKYFFLDNLVDYQLSVMALCIQDNWGNKNHFFSIRNIQKDINDADPEEAACRKVVVSPWDLDASLGGYYDGTYYDGTYNTWAVKDVVKNGGFYPFTLCQGESEYKALLKARWKELRQGVYAPDSINARLEAYANLFVKSGAWERQATVQPKYVSDLMKEIGYIETWYAARYAEMDAYFGIETAISTPTHSQPQPGSQAEAVYSIDGKRLKAAPAKGIYIQGGKKLRK